MKSIVVTISFDSNDAKNLSFAVELAKTFNTDLKLLHIIHRTGSMHVVPSSSVGSEPIHEAGGGILMDEIKEAEKGLKEFARTILTDDGITCMTLVKVGNINEDIIEQEERTDIGLIIMGAPGMSIFHKLLGSRAYKVATKSSIPTLVIPEDHYGRTINALAVGVDYKDWNEADDSWLREFAEANNSVLNYFRVEAELGTQELAKFEAFKSKLENLHLNDKVTSTYELIQGAHIDDEAVSYVHKSASNIIALQHTHDSLWKKLFSENVTKELIFESDVPVLIY